MRRTRTFARDAAGSSASARGEVWLHHLVSSIAAHRPLAQQLATGLENLPGAKLGSWMAESSIGTYPLEVVASSRSGDNNTLPDGAFAVLSLELALDGVPWLGAAPAFVGRN